MVIVMFSSDIVLDFHGVVMCNLGPRSSPFHNVSYKNECIMRGTTE